MSRREMLRHVAVGGLALSGLGGLLAACGALEGAGTESATQSETPTGDGAQSDERAPREAPPEYRLSPGEPDSPAGEYTPEQEAAGAGRSTDRAPVARKPAGEAQVSIDGLGDIAFDAGAVSALRPDIFQDGHYSLFDILVHIANLGHIDLEYHFDESADTHIIDSLNGEAGWWHQAFYSAGWPEASAFRMDMYPYKRNSVFRLEQRRASYLGKVHDTFREEVDRLATNGGRVIIPNIEISSPRGEWNFDDVEVTAHDLRTDVLRPGTITALDAILSLRDQRKLNTVGLTWYDRIGPADPVDSYWLERVDDAVAQGGCGFVYETGPRQFAGFSGAHIHIPADVRVTVSPEYALWFWICLGRG
jgi:hypothetical protein